MTVKLCKICNTHKDLAEFSKIKIGKKVCHRDTCKQCTPKKYKNKVIEKYGRKWDSSIELEYYENLLKVYRIEDIQIQPVFELQPSFKKLGKIHRKIEYIADFRIDNVVYEVKGMIDQKFPIKRKIFEYKYPELTLVIIKKEKGKFVQI